VTTKIIDGWLAAKRVGEVCHLSVELRVIIVDARVEHGDQDATTGRVGGHLIEIPQHVLPGIVGYLHALLGLAARRGVGRTRHARDQHAGADRRERDKY
jgi:hypothetical protein